MKIWGIVLFVIVLISITIVVILITFKYLIKKNIIKPSKISRIFYNDDEIFIDSWKKTQEKGILKYMIKNVIIETIAIGILGKVIILYKPEMGSLFVYLLTGIIAGLMLTSIYWSENQNRYNQLKEKRKKTLV
ncbi:hypothetical protein [Clostridium sp. JS66]|uniref:hypothetical protein n=1 Tax=Clostridium sp. JS66 TaxID=3064705 RepID=UPI00298EAB79|nr:hypothetical protein [Clostridium sp. JS66]WPC39659.1 hypothetical protein Q6H37_17260 [Clostridium sp. JS66]